MIKIKKRKKEKNEIKIGECERAKYGEKIRWHQGLRLVASGRVTYA